MKRLALVALAALLAAPSLAQVCSNSVTLRQETCPAGTTCTTKGSTLTFAEMDDNLAGVAELCAWTTEYDAFTSIDEGVGAAVAASGHETIMFKATSPLTVSVSREVASPYTAYALYELGLVPAGNLDCISAACDAVGTDGQVLSRKLDGSDVKFQWADDADTVDGPKQSFYRFNGYANCGVDSSSNFMGLARANCNTTESLIERAVSTSSTLTVGNIYCYQTQDTTCTVTAMLRKNQADTDFSCTITGGGSCADGSGTLTYADGDDIVFELTDDASTCDTDLFMECGVYFTWTASGSGTSEAVALDLEDDDNEESTALNEIAVTNDTRSAFTEPSADKLLIDVNKIRLPSLLNPRVTPHANDCEFDSGVCAGWSWSSAPSSGTVNPVVAPGTDVYDASAWPGWLLVQSASNHALRYSAGTTLNSDFTAWGHFMMSDTTVATTSVERRVGLGAWNSADTNESIACSITTNSSGAYRVQLLIQNNGSYSTQESHTIEDGEFMDPIIALYRTGNDFWCMVYSPTGGSFTLGAKLTKTGTVTFDTFEAYLCGDNITPLPVLGVDFVRFAESLKLPEMN